MSQRDDEDDALARQRTLVKNAEDMAREHSARREIRMREDRVRHLSSEPGDGQSASGVRKVRPIEERAEPAPAVDDDRSGKKPRLSDPFPPLADRKKTPPASAGPAPSVERKPSRAPLAPQPPLSAVDELAVEVEDLVRRARIGWQSLETADRITVFAALGTLGGTLAPWLSLPGRPFQLGIFVGGVLHAALAICALALVVYRASEGWLGSLRSADRVARRVSLYHVLLGALSTVLGALLLVYWGMIKSPELPVRFHLGFYWTLCCGTGLSYGGFARFGSRRPDPDR